MRVRFILALWAAKLAMFVARVTGRGKGSSLPGKIALKIYPGILKRLGREIKKRHYYRYRHQRQNHNQ